MTEANHNDDICPTYVLAITYVLATLVNNSNFSAVIDPILTKLFRPNIWGSLIFVNFFFVGTKIFWPKYFWDPTFYWTKFVLWPKFFRAMGVLINNFFSGPNIFRPFIYFYLILIETDFFLPKNCSDLNPKLLWRHFSWTTFVLDLMIWT